MKKALIGLAVVALVVVAVGVMGGGDSARQPAQVGDIYITEYDETTETILFDYGRIRRTFVGQGCLSTDTVGGNCEGGGACITEKKGLFGWRVVEYSYEDSKEACFGN